MLDHDEALPEFRQCGGNVVLHDAFDEVLISDRVYDLTYDNRQMRQHDPWFQDHVGQMVIDGGLLPAEDGPTFLHDPSVVPHHRPGIAVRRRIIPFDGGAVWREAGTCYRCVDLRSELEQGIDLDLPVEPLFILWVRGDSRNIVEVGLCRMCAHDLVNVQRLAPTWKALPRG